MTNETVRLFLCSAFIPIEPYKRQRWILARACVMCAHCANSMCFIHELALRSLNRNVWRKSIRFEYGKKDAIMPADDNLRTVAMGKIRNWAHTSPKIRTENDVSYSIRLLSLHNFARRKTAMYVSTCGVAQLNYNHRIVIIRNMLHRRAARITHNEKKNCLDLIVV